MNDQAPDPRAVAVPMPTSTLDVLRALEEIEAAPDTAVEACFAAFGRRLGASHYAILRLAGPGEGLSDVLVAADLPDAYVRLLDDPAEFARSPDSRYAQLVRVPFWGSEAEAAYAGDPRPAAYARHAEFGLARRLCIPVSSTDGVKGLVHVAGPTLADPLVERWALTLLATEVFNRLVRLAPYKRREGLSDDERLVLLAVARGRTNEEIAAELGVSPRTVAVRVERASAWLGAKNRVQAVAEAMRRGVIHL